VKCLTLSNQKQRFWLERIFRPISKEMGYSDENKHKNKATIIDYLEQLQIEYCKEKAKWLRQVDTLKQRICSLMSELQDAKSLNQKANEQLANLKSFYGQNQLVVCRNIDIDKDSHIMSVKTKSRDGSVSSKRTFTQEPLLSKLILKESRNLLVPNDRKKLKLVNSDFQKKLDMEARRRNETLSLSEKYKCAKPMIIKSPQVKHPLLKTTKSISYENSCREICDSFSKEEKSGWKCAKLGDDTKSNSILKKSSEVSLKGSIIKQQSQQFQEKLLLTTEICNADIRIFGNIRKRQKPEKKTDTLNERVSKVNKKGILLDLGNQEDTVRCFKQNYKGSSERLSRSPCEITIRSAWI